MDTLAIPAQLLERGFLLRPETDADIPFLRHLYASTRWDELARTDWNDTQKLSFINSQFDLQRHHYRTYFPETEWGILEDNGQAAGRLYIHWGNDKLEVLDIALLPRWRGRGIGTALMEAVCSAARAGGKTVGLTVEKFNPAHHLYSRLGFRASSEDDIYFFMQWRALPNDQLNIA